MTLTARLRSIAAVLIGLGLAGCTPAASDPGLRVAGNPTPAMVLASNVAASQPVTFGSIILCLEEAGSVTVRTVELVEPSGSVRLDSFALRPNPFVRQQPGVGAERSTLEELEFDPSVAQVVDTECPGEGEDETWDGGSELAFQVSYDGSTETASASLNVTYEYASSGSRVLAIPFGVALCPGPCPDPSPP
jgi:hypothetical protein